MPSLPWTLLLFLQSALAFSVSVPERRDASASSLYGTNKISAGWYPGWRSEVYPAGKISWSKYTSLIYAFGETTPDLNTISLENSNEAYLPTFVQTAHQHNVKASLSIGGWGGSRYFSSHVGSEQNRTAFINTLATLVTKYDLDGLDFDWEFPNSPGVGCNVHSPNDTANFLSFLQEFRANPSVPKNITLSAATFVRPWNDSSSATNPSPSTDVSGFKDVLDYIAIMNYDVWNLYAPFAGPNAPLNDTCASDASHQRGSAVSAVDAWTKAGFPRDQIVLAVPMYGRSFTVPSAQALGGSDGKTIQPFPSYKVGDEKPAEDGDIGGPDVCGVKQVPSGIFNYATLMERGIIQADGTGASGVPYRFDECSQTPYVYNTSSQVLISYDNPQSFAVKGAFINDAGLKGFAAWDVTTDHGSDLLNSILSAITANSSLASLNVSGSAVAPASGASGGTSSSSPGGAAPAMISMSRASLLSLALAMSACILYL